jgi:hypothetical protein
LKSHQEHLKLNLKIKLKNLLHASERSIDDLMRAVFKVLSDKLEHIAKGTSTSTSYQTEIQPLQESSSALFLEKLSGF